SLFSLLIGASPGPRFQKVVRSIATVHPLKDKRNRSWEWLARAWTFVMSRFALAIRSWTWGKPGVSVLNRFNAVLLLVCFACHSASAGIDEVYAANDRGDYDEEVRLLQPLVQQGVPAAQSMLGYLYSVGHGVPQDPSKAVEWLTKAGNGGYVDAMTYLAW